MKTNFSCIIIDDEPEAIDLLKGRLQLLYQDVAVSGTYTTWQEGINGLRTMQADILLLDIAMPGCTGFDLLKLMPDIESEIIFTTAYSEYALEAFKFSASGYLLKPIDDKELVLAINRSLDRVNNKKLARQNMPAASLVKSKIGIPQGKAIDYFDIDDILYFEAVSNYTKVITRNGSLLSSYNIGKYNAVLQHLPFRQVHRSYIVNMNCVSRYEATGIITMVNKKEIPIARKFRDQFLNSLLSNQINDEAGKA